MFVFLDKSNTRSLFQKTMKCQRDNVTFFFFKHLSGPDAQILKFDWLIMRT